MAIAQFLADPEQSRSLQGFPPAGGPPSLFSSATDGVVCRFRTAYPVTLWPVAPAAVDFVPPGAYAFLDDRADVASVLRLRLRCLGKRRFAEFAPPLLRFYLHGPLATTGALYELLFNRAIELAVLPAATVTGERVMAPPRCLPACAIRPVGFGTDEAVLPCPPHAHQAYLLLQEYFIFPEKCLFFDIEGLGDDGMLGTVELDLLFLFSERPREGLVVTPDTLRLGCPRATAPARQSRVLVHPPSASRQSPPRHEGYPVSAVKSDAPRTSDEPRDPVRPAGDARREWRSPRTPVPPAPRTAHRWLVAHALPRRQLPGRDVQAARVVAQQLRRRAK